MQKFNFQELNIIKSMAENRKVKNDLLLQNIDSLNLPDNEQTKLIIYSENRVLEQILNKVEKYINID
jgi:hypothetical protein